MGVFTQLPLMVSLNHLSAANRDGDFEPISPNPVWDFGCEPLLCFRLHVVASDGLSHPGLADAAACPHGTRLPLHPSLVVGVLDDKGGAQGKGDTSTTDETGMMSLGASWAQV